MGIGIIDMVGIRNLLLKKEMHNSEVDVLLPIGEKLEYKITQAQIFFTM